MGELKSQDDLDIRGAEGEDPRLNAFLAGLGAPERAVFAEAVARWRRRGGKIAFLGRAVALQAPWQGSNVTFLWAHAPAGSKPARFEAPFAALARKGVPPDLLEEWRDDLTTVPGLKATIESPSAVAHVAGRFGAAEAAKIVDSALDLHRRL